MESDSDIAEGSIDTFERELKFLDDIYAMAKGDKAPTDTLLKGILRRRKYIEEEQNTSHEIFQRRYLVAFLAFLCGMVIQSQRVNISFAIVAMVNTTTNQLSLRNQSSTDCEPTYFKTESMQMQRMPEFTWNPEIQSYILSSSYIGYIMAILPGGYLTERYGVKPVLFASIFGASLCNVLSPTAARIHPYLLAAVHLIRGIFQGPPSAAFAPLMARWFPIHERGFLATFLYLGFPIGAFTGSIISGPISEINLDGGWPLIFYAFGIFGFIVCILLLILYAETPAEDARISDRELQYIQENTKGSTIKKNMPTPWKAMLTSISTHALFISMFGQYWMIFYLLIIHPIYMDSILHIPVKENGLLASGPQLTQALVGFCTCWLSIWLSRRKVLKVSYVRKGYQTLGCSMYVLGILGLYLSGCNTTLNEVFLFVVASSAGFTFAGCLIVAADMTPAFCGTLAGLGGTIASSSGFIIPFLIGQLTKEEQTMVQWHKMFLITSCVVFGSGMVFLTYGSAEIQPYDPAYVKETKEETKKEISLKQLNKQEIKITKF